MTQAARPLISMLCWHDYTAITRTRCVPSAILDDRLRNGLGWATAGWALDPFEGIAANPWGPVSELRQVPDMSARVILPGDENHAGMDLILVNSRTLDGDPWPACPRQMARAALDKLHRQEGLSLLSTMEHEFSYDQPGLAAGTPFSVQAIRRYADFADKLVQAAQETGLPLETVEPEFGRGQMELAFYPQAGMGALDTMVMVREVVREVARRCGGQASFTPKRHPQAVGNGAHLHFSFVDGSGTPILYDPSTEHGFSERAGWFIGGVFAHLRGLLALTAASPVSYLRLKPHSWAAGFTAFGVQNRECALRVCPAPAGSDPARAINLEYRPMDGTANPHLAIAGILEAGLEGMRLQTPPPPVCPGDPADMSEPDRRALGIEPLPQSLEEALRAFRDDQLFADVFDPEFRDVYIAIKRHENKLANAKTPEDLCAAYFYAYA